MFKEQMNGWMDSLLKIMDQTFQGPDLWEFNMKEAHHSIESTHCMNRRGRNKRIGMSENCYNRDISTKCQDCQEDKPLNL